MTDTPTGPSTPASLTQVIPCGNRLLVRRDTATAMIGNIEIPKDAQEVPTTGVILAAAPGALGTQDSVIGKRVMFATYSGVSVKVNGEDLLMLTTDEILAIIQS